MELASNLHITARKQVENVSHKLLLYDHISQGHS